MQTIRLLAREAVFSDKAIAAVFLLLCIAGMTKSYRWYKRPKNEMGKITTAAGVYIVTLNNEEPISVNAHDPRRAETAIKVTRENCKFGKANDLRARKENYDKTFGAENVNFFAIATLKDIHEVEKAVLLRLGDYRIIGNKNRKNEWLTKITPMEVENIVFTVLAEGNFEYLRIGSVHNI